jgi:hypothetical protein
LSQTYLRTCWNTTASDSLLKLGLRYGLSIWPYIVLPKIPFCVSFFDNPSKQWHFYS